MTITAHTRYQEALANDIAAALRRAPQANGRVAVRWDRAAETYAVRVTIERQRFDLLMPHPGALYALFRNGTWLGGMNTSTDATAYQVAMTLLDRIAAALR